MKASVIRTIGQGFAMAELEIAEPEGREVLVNVKASGLCHSDELAATHDFGWPLPLLQGHEVAGVVAAVGPDAREFAVGQHVVACAMQYCGTCRNCVVGKSFLCLDASSNNRPEGAAPRLTEHGKAVPQGGMIGGFAQQVLLHENQLARIPEAMPWAQAALLGCGVVTGAGAVLNTADVQPTDTVVVIGVGGVGLNALNGAVVAGAATIIAVDVADDKLERARRFGATHVINSSSSDAVAAVREITGVGADAVFDNVGIEQVTRQALDMVAPGGCLYLVGVLDPTMTIDVSPMALLAERKRIEGVFLGSTVAKRDIPLYAQLYLEGRFRLDELVSKEIALDQINEGYEMLKDSSVARIVITDLL